jgi:hypothetical protein
VIGQLGELAVVKMSLERIRESAHGSARHGELWPHNASLNRRGINGRKLAAQIARVDVWMSALDAVDQDGGASQF